jgi:hypothetical protein
MGCTNLKYFELFKSSFLIFKNNVEILNILLLFLELISKIKNHNFFMMFCKVKKIYYFGMRFYIPRSQMINLSYSIIFVCQNIMGY